MRKGTKFSEASKEKMRQAALGRKHSFETKQKIGKFFKGRPNGKKGIPNPSKIKNITHAKNELRKYSKRLKKSNYT